jgi:hypothetical protein
VKYTGKIMLVIAINTLVEDINTNENKHYSIQQNSNQPLVLLEWLLL